MWRSKLVQSIAISLAVVGLSACQVNNINLKPLMDATSKSAKLGDKSIEEEVAMGREVSAFLLEKASLMNVSEVQVYVSSVGQWLAQNTERKDLPWTFAVLRDDSFNAYATPGGYIFITTGTLARLDSEAELAGILAHEIAHVVQRHHLNAINKETKMDIALDLAKFLRDADRDDSSAGMSMMFEDVTAEGQLMSTLQDIYSSGLAREDEFEADRMGMVIATRAGYDPMVYIKVLQRIDAEQNDSPFWQSFARRHPNPSARMEALQETADYLIKQQGEVLQKRYYDTIW